MRRLTSHNRRIPRAALRRRRAIACQHFISQRSLIGRHIGFDLCPAPVWDMFLDLYAARSKGEKISITSLCLASHVPATTALRHIGLLVEQNYLIRRRDPDDARRILVELSDDARSMLDRCLDALTGLP
jgi:hypothetical protein